MVAIIKSGHSIQRLFNYNENKVKEGVAECISAGNYPLDLDRMNSHLRLNRLVKQLQLNENVKCNSVHISLNFDISEGNLAKEKLVEIADTYMEKIGFGQQPYLVYQHYDAGHPHLHIASINIEEDGKRIDLHKLGIRKSEPARKEIEGLFNLVKAEAQKKSDYKLAPIPAQRVQYGKLETKKAIQTVLNAVVDQYRFTSLAELNAVLKQYNVMADKGSEDSRVAKHNGLLYHVIDDKGKTIGVPIKASAFYNSPTLSKLATKYQANEVGRSPYKTRIKNAIDMALLGKMVSMPELLKKLEKDGIQTVLRQNESGLVYGLTYVDHTTKCVFNGSALGKQYSAKAIHERCGLQFTHGAGKSNTLAGKTFTQESLISFLKEHKDSLSILDVVKLVDALTKAEFASGAIPYSFKNNKKKRRRKRGL